MAETIRIDCPAGQYTALTAGHQNVAFEPSKVYGDRMIIAASLPAPSAGNYKTVLSGKQVELGGLAFGDIVYWMPGNVAETIEVTRG